MKTTVRFLQVFMAFLIIPLLYSCEKKADNTATGVAEFSVSVPSELDAKSASSDTSIAVSFQMMVSVEDLTGNVIFNDKLIPLYTFGTGLMSENVEIRTGEFRLTKFLVINASGAVVYAAPMAGSPLAYLSKRPLPFNFNIFPNQVTRIAPEVLEVGSLTPDKFGYAAFGVQIIKPVDLWTMAVLDPGNPQIMAPIQITEARLTVLTPDGWKYTFKLAAAVNHLIIRGGSEKYTLILEKDGYVSQKLEFTAAVLKATTKENPLILKIPWQTKYFFITLQPGPEKGKDAMISNLEPEKNFGGHKYFEATFLTEPVLTVMRSNRSLIAFNLDTIPKSAVIQKVILKLSYDVPIPFDDVYLTQSAGPTAGAVWYGGVLQQVVEPWEEFKVTWNSQPKSIEINQVFIPPFIRNTNSIEVDVTRLFVHPATTDAAVYPNYGMLFKLWPSDRFPGFRFASSDYPLTSSTIKMWPALTIYFTLP
jgi:hypothetical protein